MARTDVAIPPATATRSVDARRRLLSVLATAPCVLLLLLDSLAVAAAVHLASRLAYVLYAGWTLSRRSRAGWIPKAIREREFASFRSAAWLLMENDALTFLALLLVSQPRFTPAIPVGATWIVAVGLIVLGIGCKAWAARVLGAGAYYWHDFFHPPVGGHAQRRGPYRWLRDPMYTVGYAHAYGAALLLLSWPGLVAALVDQAAILTLHWLVERPHVRAIYGAPPHPERAPAGPGITSRG